MRASSTHYLLTDAQIGGPGAFNPNGVVAIGPEVTRRPQPSQLIFSRHGQWLAAALAQPDQRVSVEMWALQPPGGASRHWSNLPAEVELSCAAQDDGLLLTSWSTGESWRAPDIHKPFGPLVACAQKDRDSPHRFQEWMGSILRLIGASPYGPTNMYVFAGADFAPNVDAPTVAANADCSMRAALFDNALYLMAWPYGAHQRQVHVGLRSTSSARAVALWFAGDSLFWLTSRHAELDPADSDGPWPSLGAGAYLWSTHLPTALTRTPLLENCMAVAPFAVNQATVSPCGRWLAAVASREGSGHGQPYLFDTAAGGPFVPLEVGRSWEAYPSCYFLFSPDGQTLLIQLTTTHVPSLFTFSLRALGGLDRTRYVGRPLALKAAGEQTTLALGPHGASLASASDVAGDAAVVLYALTGR